jgi:serine/threonine-protein kinase
LVGGGAVAAAAALAFLLLGGAKTGKLVVTVAGPGGKAVDNVEILIDGEPACTTSPCIREEVTPGTHVVSVKAKGYQATAGKALTVEGGKDVAENIELLPEAGGGGLKVSAEGSGLKLYVDGKEIGPLPQEVKDLEPGQHTVKIAGNDNIAPYEEKVTVSADRVVDLSPKLKLVKGSITISLGDDTKGAKIFLVDGGKRKALSKQSFPLTIEVPAEKEYTVVAEKKGFEDFEERVSFDDGKAEKSVTVELTSESDSSSSSSGSASTGSTGTGSSRPSPSPAPAAASGQGTLNINSIPVSNVILDGKPLGSTPKIGVKVSAGSHTVVFVHPQFGRKVRAVTVAAGSSTSATTKFP